VLSKRRRRKEVVNGWLILVDELTDAAKFAVKIDDEKNVVVISY